MKTRKKNITQPKETLLLVCATEAEALYFSQMRKDCRYVNLTVMQVPEGKAKNLEALIDFTGRQRSRGRFDSAWALFGFDDLGVGVNDVKEMEEYAAKKKVKMLYFNPTFELWFLLHLGTPGAFVSDAGAIKEKVRIGVTNGTPFSAEYLLTNGLNLHIRLFPMHSKADLGARNYNDIVRTQTGLEATTMPLFDEDIEAICGKADMSHNQKARR